MTRPIRFLTYFLLSCVVLTPILTRGAEVTLRNTTPLTLMQPVDTVMVDGINRFCLRALASSPGRRAAHWQRDFTEPGSYIVSVAHNRERFRKIIGAIDPRVSAEIPNDHHFELFTALGEGSAVAHSDDVTVHAVRWQVLDGVTAEGLLLKPDRVLAHVVALPDADWTPEMFCGLSAGLPVQTQLARRLAAAGCLVVIPTLISRSDEFSGSPHVGYTNLTHREFLYRQAFEAGRHIIGYEVQKILAAVDLLEHLVRRPTSAGVQDSQPLRTPLPIGVAGVGEGGLLALYAAAIDQRIDSTLVCGYFQAREGIWQEPIYRNVWSLLTEFGDAELAGLVAPRRLVVEACRAVEVDGPPAVRDGRRQSAAPGRIETNRLSDVQTEFQRGSELFRKLRVTDQLVLAVSGPAGDGPAGTSKAIAAFAAGLSIDARVDQPLPSWQLTRPPSGPHTMPEATPFDRSNRKRQQRQFLELQTQIQKLLRLSPKVRDARWRPGPSSVEAWQPVRRRLSQQVHDEMIGRLPSSTRPPNPRTRRILETDTCVGYEVVLDVFEDVIAAGILLLPKDLKSGEKRPVVVCQHGLEATPMDTISRAPRAFRSYKAFSAELCNRGFIVYAPQNPYRGQDRFRSIQRKANPLKRSLFSFIIAQHQQTLEWLATVPHVDAERIAFYGLSYGGKTAMRVPPFVDRYCLAICSGDFTDWVRTLTTVDYRYGYGFTGEYETPEWNLAHIASHAELAMLMCPRPFMVEQGHHDGGAPTEWVAGEFGKVRRHYDLLKIGDRTEIEFFDGPHTINGQGSFDFLHRHLHLAQPDSSP